MKNMQKSMQKVLLLASAMSAFAAQAIFASQIAREVASGIATADNERERERVTPAQSLRSLGKWILANLANQTCVILKIANINNLKPQSLKIHTLLG